MSSRPRPSAADAPSARGVRRLARSTPHSHWAPSFTLALSVSAGLVAALWQTATRPRTVDGPQRAAASVGDESPRRERVEYLVLATRVTPAADDRRREATHGAVPERSTLRSASAAPSVVRDPSPWAGAADGPTDPPGPPAPPGFASGPDPGRILSGATGSLGRIGAWVLLEHRIAVHLPRVELAAAPAADDSTSPAPREAARVADAGVADAARAAAYRQFVHARALGALPAAAGAGTAASLPLPAWADGLR